MQCAQCGSGRAGGRGEVRAGAGRSLLHRCNLFTVPYIAPCEPLLPAFQLPPFLWGHRTRPSAASVVRWRGTRCPALRSTLFYALFIGTAFAANAPVEDTGEGGNGGGREGGRQGWIHGGRYEAGVQGMSEGMRGQGTQRRQEGDHKRGSKSGEHLKRVARAAQRFGDVHGNMLSCRLHLFSRGISADVPRAISKIIKWAPIVLCS